MIFVFYLIFPFFCWLIENKRRAWISFGISLIYNFVCDQYFEIGRTNILYSGCFFLAGGLIYLHREQIEDLFDNRKRIMLLAVAVSVAFYYIVGGDAMMCLLVSSVLLMYALLKSGGVLDNSITHFFSSISMEIYLSHMVVFRALEKIKINTVIGDGWIQYVFTVTVVLFGAILFAVIMKKTIGMAEKFFSKIKGD